MRADVTAQVRVSTSARLHLGFLDLNFGLARRFASIGLALDAPRTIVTVRRAAAISVTGPEQTRAMRHLAALTRHLGVSDGLALAIDQAIPAHAGLGSGTQLALAIGAALRRLHGVPQDPAADALLLGRGARSGIGIGLFRTGGFVLDGGRGEGAGLPPVLLRLPMPAEWRVLLLLDPAGSGLSGNGETNAFATLPPQSPEAAGEACRVAVMRLLPSLAERDLAGFGAAITRIQEICGDHFAPAQGGRFISPIVAAALDALGRAGAVGLGQSSWGPTGFAFAPDAATARRLATCARAAAAGALDIQIRRGLNRGATIAVA